MRSFITSAVLASAIFGSTALSATSAHRHSHAHRHAKKSTEKRSINIDSVLASAGVKAVTTTPSEITEGTDGPFVIDFVNDSNKDIVVVTWSGADGQATWTSMCVNANSPSLTTPVLPGESATISINPGSAGSLSGGFAALYPITNLSPAGSINNTWVEWTYTTQSQFSAVDVSRLVNMAGNGASVETYASYPPSGDALCVSDMETCVFKCTDGTNSCIDNYKLEACEGANTQNFGGTSGGCGGFTASGGYTKISFKH